MIQALQWSALVICGAVALARFPDAIRGRNRSIFGAFLLTTFAILLSIDAPYLAVDAWLGGANYANLLLRFLVYGAVMLAGYRTAKAFGDASGTRRITGPAGLAVLAGIAAVTTVTFLLADTAGSSTGLTGLPLRSEANAQLIGLYATAGRVYPAFVAVCLVPATLRAVGGRFPRALRTGALLLSVGYAAMVAGALYPLLPAGRAWCQSIISYAAVLGVSLGLTVIWLARLAATRRQARTRVRRASDA
jgi:hypothetical protein